MLDELDIGEIGMRYTNRKYDASGLNLGECIDELKRINQEISTTGIIKGNSKDTLRFFWMSDIIKQMDRPEIVGYEEKEHNIQA
tara:strand:+ start:335 stop:586 length:252 start_codon:yes stop_codon:yes gene_type:complete